MRILADENVPRPVIHALRERGHDVLSVSEVLRGSDDRAVLRRAEDDGRGVLTYDKDFGELASNSGLPATCGVVLFRLSGNSAEEDQARAVAAVESRQEWAGAFAVVTDALIRLRPLPES